MYEQDWLNVVMEGMFTIQQDPQLGRKWLLQMGRAADKVGLAVQYCMSLPCVTSLLYLHAPSTLPLPSVFSPVPAPPPFFLALLSPRCLAYSHLRSLPISPLSLRMPWSYLLFSYAVTFSVMYTASAFLSTLFPSR